MTAVVGQGEAEERASTGNDPVGGSDTLLGAAQLFGALFRYLVVVATVAVAGLAALYIYQKTLDPRFASQADLLMDIKQMLRANNRLDASTGVPKASLLFTQTTLMTSKGSLEAVAKELDLVKEPEFQDAYWSELQQRRGWFDQAVGLFRNPEIAAAEGEAAERLASAVDELRKYILIEVPDDSYIVNIIYMGRDPVLAAKISNAVARRYMTEQLTARYEATLKAGDWVERRLDQLKDQSRDAALRVEDFRRDYGITRAAGRTLTDAELGELADKVVEAHSDASEADARKRVIDRILENRDTNIDLFQSVDDATALELRQRYAVAQALRAQTLRLVGREDHEALQQQDETLASLRNQLWQSLERYSRQVNEANDIAVARLADLERTFEQAKARYVEEHEVGVKLDELEREANVMHQTYANFYRGYVQLSQKNPFPTSEVRQIAKATPSFFPSYPVKSSVLANGAIAFLALGLTTAILLSRSRTSLRSATDVPRLVGVAGLGTVERTAGSGGAVTEAGLLASSAFHRAATRVAADLRPYGQQTDGTSIAILDDTSDDDAATVASALAKVLADYGESVLLVRTVRGGGDDDYRMATVDEGLDVLAIPLAPGANGWVDYRAAVQVALEAGRTTHHFVIFSGPPVRASAPARAMAALADGILVTARARQTDGPSLRSHLVEFGAPASKVTGVLILDAKRRWRLLRHLLLGKSRSEAPTSYEPVAEAT